MANPIKVDMTYIDTYIQTLCNNIELQKSVLSSSEIIVNAITEKFKFCKQLNGLLVGDVQSGKTGQMLGIISRMADQGYRFFVLLTTDNIDLQRQTYKRIKEALPTFNVLSERDEVLFRPENLSQPYIIVLKKNGSVLRKWRNLFIATNACKGLCLAIFDDEADAISLNTNINKRSVSPINKILTEIKNTAIATVYIEVTATPQAVLLQTEKSGWKADFVKYIKPGSKYLGGDFFFSEEVSSNIIYTNEYELGDMTDDDDVLCPLGLKESLRSFLLNCAYKKVRGETNCNFLIHPSYRINIHSKFVKIVQEELNLLVNSTTDINFEESFYEAWLNLSNTKKNLPSLSILLEIVISILENTEVIVIPLNSKSFICRDSRNPDALDLSKGFNIVVGGNTLGRGLTFPNLQTVYYCRTARVPQADTFWQHSRVFGYDRDPDMVRIFIPESTYHLFVELNKADNLLKKQIESGVDMVELIYPHGIKPTRSNVIKKDELNLLYGCVNYFTQEPLGINIDSVDKIVLKYVDKDSVLSDKETVIKILKLLDNHQSNDFDTLAFISCIEAMCIKNKSLKFRLIVRKNRNISKGTGTLLSEKDRLLGDKYKNEVVLTLYRLTGLKEQGWLGKPLWVQNIKLPHNICYYNIKQ